MKRTILYVVLMLVVFGCTSRPSEQSADAVTESNKNDTLNLAAEEISKECTLQQPQAFIAIEPSRHQFLDTLKIVDLGVVKEMYVSEDSSLTYTEIRKVVLPYSANNGRINDELTVNLIENGDSVVSLYDEDYKRPTHDIEICFNHYNARITKNGYNFSCHTKRMVVTREEMFRFLKEEGYDDYWNKCTSSMDIFQFYVKKMYNNYVAIYLYLRTDSTDDFLDYVLQIDLKNEIVTVIRVTDDGVMDDEDI